MCFRLFLSLRRTASRPHRLSHTNALRINQSYSPKDQSVKFWWKLLSFWWWLKNSVFLSRPFWIFFFHIFRIFFLNTFIKNPQTTIAPTFLTLIISAIGGVCSLDVLKIEKIMYWPQSCNRSPLCSTLKFENLRSPKKNDFFHLFGVKKDYISQPKSC